MQSFPLDDKSDSFSAKSENESIIDLDLGVEEEKLIEIIDKKCLRNQEESKSPVRIFDESSLVSPRNQLG